jgi:hypothetical protein
MVNYSIDGSIAKYIGRSVSEVESLDPETKEVGTYR